MQNFHLSNTSSLIFKIVKVFVFVLLIGSCGLFEKKIPPGGEFCNVLVKPPECINVDFKELKINFSEEEKYPLTMINRVQYSFNRNDSIINLDLHSENRIQLSDGKFYLRRKVKR
ncbi:hypothetical protein [Leptospira sp. GIMC2001]|uniref:hypothetical protein n=1 Tax=Leptospira sp. GIMC2001 TaxID=1513297 RepID=UPI002349EF10|nr:hypothetical protein [Leptospira sp. GIMC2001]WCL49138.1 hypothetical protein O4O04_17880 [Leptospira sp. GIMC2001]